MKKLFYTFLSLIFMVSISMAQDVHIAAYYNVPDISQDTLLSGLTSIRGANYSPDLLGDGTAAIVVTNYEGHTVAVFATVGNDSIELKWVSPRVTESPIYKGSTPRFACFGDLDNDGLNEVIFNVDPYGMVIYEWDGVAGSWNFGNTPSQVINLEALVGETNGYFSEYFEVEDVDGDGSNELLLATNASGSSHDNYYIISANGNWMTNSPGFSSFNVEATFYRKDLDKWGIKGGSPYALIAANLDGEGNPEIILHNWNHKNVVPIRVPSADTYELSDTTNGKQNCFLSGAEDEVALFAGVACDIDGDGREEVYLPTFSSSKRKGVVHMIHYEAGQSTAEIDSAQNVFAIDMSSVSGANQFGIGYGDLDGNGKLNLYVAGGYGHNVTSAEFEGGDKTDPNNWKYSVVYTNTPDIYNDVTIRDSAGVTDTIATVNTAFVSKLYAKNTDFDKDGKQDIIMPYQALNDNTTYTHLTWNSTTSTWDTTSTETVHNPKAWGLRILEAGSSTGIEAKDMAIITPKDYKLEQNYPNPFNPTTTIKFSLPVKNTISLTVYNILGEKVKTLISSQVYNKGSYKVAWDGTNDYGQKVASGNYIYTLKFGNFQISKKMTLLK